MKDMRHAVALGGAVLPGQLAIDSVTRTFLGYHQFQDAQGGAYGSFEVFHVAFYGGRKKSRNGFYWHACQPGCLPDGDPCGPFPTAEGAYLDAIGD